jgi:replication factor C large subunit
MLLEKYEPRLTKEILGNEKQVIEIRNWLRSWSKGRALLVYGPTGSGKSLAVRLIAEELGYEILESNASDRSIPSILKASEQRSLFSRKKLILIDEVDLLESGKGVSELIEKSDFPVIFIAVDPYKRNLAFLRKHCRLLKFEKLRYDIIARFLREICEKEKISYEEKALFQIARMSNGDIRAALLDLEVLKPNISLESAYKLGYREKEENVFSTLKTIFSSKKLADARIAIKNCEKNPDELFLWLGENAGEYRNIEDIALAYDYLSKADIFRSRIIKRQAWSLQKYFLDLCMAGFVLSKGSVFVYKYPKFMRKNNLSAVSEKVSKKLHLSARESLEILGLIKLLIEKEPSLASKLSLNEDDLSLLS